MIIDKYYSGNLRRKKEVFDCVEKKKLNSVDFVAKLTLMNLNSVLNIKTNTQNCIF